MPGETGGDFAVKAAVNQATDPRFPGSWTRKDFFQVMEVTKRKVALHRRDIEDRPQDKLVERLSREAP
jgi:hypothetical protein